MPVESVFRVNTHQLAPTTEAHNEERQREPFEKPRDRKNRGQAASNVRNPPSESSPGPSASGPDSSQTEGLSQIIDSQKLLEMLSQRPEGPSSPLKKACLQPTRRVAARQYRQNLVAKKASKTP